MKGGDGGDPASGFVFWGEKGFSFNLKAGGAHSMIGGGCGGGGRAVGGSGGLEAHAEAGLGGHHGAVLPLRRLHAVTGAHPRG